MPITNKSSIEDIKENKNFLLSKIKNPIKEILEQTNENEAWYKILKWEYLGRKEIPKDKNKLVCKNCGEINTNFRFDFCCKNCKHEYNLKYYGKKRPEHSQKIKDHFDKGTYEVFRNIINSDLNGDHFKKTRLKNHGISFTDENFESKYSCLLKNLQTGTNHKRKTLLSGFETYYKDKWKDHEEFYILGFDSLTIEQINILGEKEIDEWFKKHNSLKSVIAYKNNPNMGRSKATWMDCLKYNKRGITKLYVRSSYEKNWVAYFEKNKITWDYEVVRINGGNFLYIPDFVLYKDNKQYIIEVKGFIPKSWIEIILKKTLCGVKYAEENNMLYGFSFDSKPKNTESYFDSLLLNQKSESEIKSILERKTNAQN